MNFFGVKVKENLEESKSVSGESVTLAFPIFQNHFFSELIHQSTALVQFRNKYIMMVMKDQQLLRAGRVPSANATIMRRRKKEIKSKKFEHYSDGLELMLETEKGLWFGYIR
jgi:hypothetical protein